LNESKTAVSSAEIVSNKASATWLALGCVLGFVVAHALSAARKAVLINEASLFKCVSEGFIQLTMRLSCRPQSCPARRERKIARSDRGAPPPHPHGPLQPMVRYDSCDTELIRPPSGEVERPHDTARTAPRPRGATFEVLDCPE
jgi:hypothetical protein